MDSFKFQFNMWFVAAWFGSAFTCLIFALVFSFYLSSAKVVVQSNQNFKLYAAVPQTGIQTSEKILSADARPKIIENFFKGYKSPLTSYGSAFVSVADKYKLDYKLLPSIAMQESKGGIRVINNSYNPFGYGIYGSLALRFTSWEQAIERVGRAMREDYLDEGLKTPVQIMAKYTPPSLAKGGPWATGVSSFMEELK